MASVSDDFDRANGEIGANWTEDDGDIDIVDNRAESQAADTYNRARYTASALDSADHQVEADVISVGGGTYDSINGAITARQPSSARTYYSADYQSQDDPDGYKLFKYVTGSPTLLDSAAVGTPGEVTTRLIVDGASQSMEVDDVEVCSDTDSDIAAGTYCGIEGYANRASFNNWAAEDLAAEGSSVPIFFHHFQQAGAI